MLKKPLFLIAALTTPLLAFGPSDAKAQLHARYPSGVHRPRARIEINPRPLLYRRCVDWYELQHRPSGTVLFPRKQCWWVRG